MLVLILVLILLLIIFVFSIFILLIKGNYIVKKIDIKNLEKENLLEEKKLLLNMNTILKEQLNAYEKEEDIYHTPNGIIKRLDIFKNKRL